MNILISGAGIAGLTLAYWLEKAGHQATVIEKSPSMRGGGYMIDFTGTGWDVADRMGLIPVIKERDYPADSVIYKDRHDRITSQISVHELLAASGNPVNYAALNRRELAEILYEKVQDRVEVIFGKTIHDIEQYGSHVYVRFSDGKTGEYDLVVGCDGIHSHTRHLAFGDESGFAHHLGYQFVLVEIPPLSFDAGSNYQMYVEPDFQVGIYPTQEDCWLTFIVFKEESTFIPPREERAKRLQERFSAMGWYMPEILDKLSAGQPIFQDTVTQIIMPQWLNGRVGVIGDSAYCPTFISGQGASMAMAGAYFLADALTETDNPAEAYALVEKQLRPHIEKIQKSAREFAPTFIPKSRFRIATINLALHLSNVPYFKGLIGKQFTVNSILAE